MEQWKGYTREYNFRNEITLQQRASNNTDNTHGDLYNIL